MVFLGWGFAMQIPCPFGCSSPEMTNRQDQTPYQAPGEGGREGFAKGAGPPRLSCSLDVLQVLCMSVWELFPDCGDAESCCGGQLQTSLVPDWVSQRQGPWGDLHIQKTKLNLEAPRPGGGESLVLCPVLPCTRTLRSVPGHEKYT